MVWACTRGYGFSCHAYMYAKCGDLSVSRNVIHMMPIKDVAWSTMIFANVMHGNGKEALFLLEKMLLSRVKPIYVNFTCSHSRLEERGVQILNLMSRDHLVESDVKHYSCMVMYGSRVGHLDEA
ncbi:hypothetical protein P8452_56689 [Trifolium repens]|nr:hypothetical protein P8452_56689 [Trifolium repens]